MNKNLTKYDWLIMETLWANSPLFLSQIMESMKKAVDWKHPTYVTYLRRLTQAGYVGYDTVSNMRRYSPVLTREQCVSEEMQSMKEKFSQKSTRLVLASLIKEGGLKDSDFEELKTLISDLQSKK